MERAGQAKSEDAKAELLQLATAWLELAEAADLKQDPPPPGPGASGDAAQRLKECLAHAEMCRVLAARTVHPQRKARLLELAAKWATTAGNA